MRCWVCSISSTLLGPQSLFAQHRVLLSFKVYWFPSMTTARALVSSTIICPWKTEMVSCFSLYSICRSHYSQSDLLKTENVFSGFPRLLNLMGNWVIIDPHSVPFAGAPLSLEDYIALPLLLSVKEKDLWTTKAMWAHTLEPVHDLPFLFLLMWHWQPPDGDCLSAWVQRGGWHEQSHASR